jgi:hypothetical protein
MPWDARELPSTLWKEGRVLSDANTCVNGTPVWVPLAVSLHVAIHSPVSILKWFSVAHATYIHSLQTRCLQYFQWCWNYLIKYSKLLNATIVLLFSDFLTTLIRVPWNAPNCRNSWWILEGTAKFWKIRKLYQRHEHKVKENIPKPCVRSVAQERRGGIAFTVVTRPQTGRARSLVYFAG